MTWETAEEDHPTAWELSTTYRKFDKGNIGNNELGNHGPSST
jgi:hypothetical protein